MKLIGYCRVSTEGQADNTSLDVQKERIQAYCFAFGHELVEMYCEVGSGKDTVNRPIFLEAMSALENADGLIALRLDRVARSCRDVLTMVEDVLSPAGKALVLLDLNVDTSSPTGKMILTVMAAVAELERNTIKERTSAGRRKAHEEGKHVYGQPKYGQTVIDGKLVRDEREQETIKLIKRHRQSGKSFGAIAKFLNEKGIPSKRGGVWYAETVKTVLADNR